MSVRFWVDFRGTGLHEDSTTRSAAWELGDGHPIVKIEGRSGGVSLDHLDVLLTKDEFILRYTDGSWEIAKALADAGGHAEPCVCGEHGQVTVASTCPPNRALRRPCERWIVDDDGDVCGDERAGSLIAVGTVDPVSAADQAWLAATILVVVVELSRFAARVEGVVAQVTEQERRPPRVLSLDVHGFFLLRDVPSAARESYRTGNVWSSQVKPARRCCLRRWPGDGHGP